MSTTTSAEQREHGPLCGQRDDTYCLHPGPCSDLWACPACGHNWTVEVAGSRTVIELEADEIGPSLRHATAKVNKGEPRGGRRGAGRAGRSALVI